MKLIKIHLTALILIVCLISIESKILSRCELTKELMKSNFSKTTLSNWICLIESESGSNTQLVTGPKTASSYSFGVFQINSSKWCTRGRKGGICNKRCEDFANDNIADDAICAKQIFDREGFKAWDGWMKKCKSKPLPNLKECGV